MANTKKYVSLDKLSIYDEKIKKVISDGDAATLAAANAAAEALGSNYDAVGSAATAEANAKAYADGKDTAIQAAQKAGDDAAAAAGVADGKAEAAQTAVDTLAGKVGNVPDGSTVMGIITNIQENAYDDTELRGLITGLDNNKADKTQVADDIAAAKTELEGKITTAQNAADAAQDDIDAFEQAYATDKAALEGAIALKADQTALDAVSGVANAAVKQSDYNAKVEALEAEDERIAGLVTAEAERAAGVEAGLDERLEKVEAFFVGAAEDEGEGESLKNALDTLVEIQNYIDTDGAAADEMVKDIAANKKAIEDHVAIDHDFAGADAALKAELNGEIAKKAAQADLEALSGTVATKAAQADLEALDGRVGDLEEASATYALKTEVEAVADALGEYEDAHAGDYTNAQIDAAIKVNTDAIAALNDTYATDAELAAAIADAKTDASNKDAVVLAEAQKGIDAVQLALDTHTGKADIHVTADDKAKWNAAADVTAKAHEHSNLAILEAITAAKVAAWDAAEQAAKTYADGLNTAMNTRVEALETWHNNFTEVSEEEINALFA